MPVNKHSKITEPEIKVVFLDTILFLYIVNNRMHITVKIPDGLEKMVINAITKIFKNLSFITGNKQT